MLSLGSCCAHLRSRYHRSNGGTHTRPLVAQRIFSSPTSQSSYSDSKSCFPPNRKTFRATLSEIICDKYFKNTFLNSVESERCLVNNGGFICWYQHIYANIHTNIIKFHQFLVIKYHYDACMQKLPDEKPKCSRFHFP